MIKEKNMSPTIIENTNLSGAYMKVLGLLANEKGNEITPLILSLTDFSESEHIRDFLDDHLIKSKLDTVQTVSETIFPHSLYKMCKYDRKRLYQEYQTNFRWIRRIKTANRNGTYFYRLIAYNKGGQPLNQLENIIHSIVNDTPLRRSKLQASIFDATVDHTNQPFQGFPCLQHVTFYKSEKGGLIMNSFYAVQYFYRRAYGNWHGLIKLGEFVARETGLEFERLNCFIGVEKLDGITKTEAKKLFESMEIIS
ncbi:hypothetical protein ACFOWA_19635 [Pedobacter lithocola]|uniref:Thymidylate synthase n=1 Tax=Pedobacter lithocola TaxID=1908239 RepID=A0ABV8PDK5_9SPHI